MPQRARVPIDWRGSSTPEAEHRRDAALTRSRRSAIILAFSLAASWLLGAAAAWAGATVSYGYAPNYYAYRRVARPAYAYRPAVRSAHAYGGPRVYVHRGVYRHWR